MQLDPIVSLSVAIAEAPGSYAVLLGAGVSRDAGVPTGEQVFWNGVGELYRLENETEKTPDQEALEGWLREQDRGDLDYSSLLELVAPDPAIRREYLAKHFEGREPGVAHERLAALAEAGYVRVFVTTNFDRLLERALLARGIEPIVVTSAAELAQAPRREHAACYVLKPHGDYLQETIRNTRGELSDLGAEIEAELTEVFDRFGLVVLGYAGKDEAITKAIRSRSSRYGLYWVARSDPAGPAGSLIEATGGRIILRESAATFLSDLERRLLVYRDHPSGNTPLEVHDEILRLARAEDRVGLAEVMRRERRQFATVLAETIEGHRDQRPEEESILDAYDAILPALHRRLAGMLPLIAYDDEVFAGEVRALTDLLERQTRPGGYTFWPELADWSSWWLTYAAGTFALRLERFEAVGALLAATFSVNERVPVRLAAPVRESAGQGLGELVLAREGITRRAVPRYSQFLSSLEQLEVVKERWPELLEGEDEPAKSADEFDFLVTLSCGLNPGRPPLAHWSMRDLGAVPLARRLRADDAFRARVAKALQLAPEEFFDRAREALERHQRPNNTFAASNANSILLANEEDLP